MLARAREAAAQYRITIAKCSEGRGYVGSTVELPGVTAGGPTITDCAAQTEEAVVTLVAYMITKGRPLPAPLSQQARTEQINLRVTPAEKQEMERKASDRGFRGLSEFLRAAALGQVQA